MKIANTPLKFRGAQILHPEVSEFGIYPHEVQGRLDFTPPDFETLQCKI